MKYRNLLLGLLTLLSNNLLASTAPKQIQISEVEILPISQIELEKYNYKANEFWIDGTDLVNDFSIKNAQEFYTTLYDVLSKNFLYPVSYQEITNKILEGIYKKGGHCPCRVVVDDTTLCPCDEFVNDGICKCNLYVKK